MSIQPVISGGAASLTSPAVQPSPDRVSAENTSKVAAPSVQVAASAVQAVSPAEERQKVKQAVEQVNKAVPSFSHNLQFSVDEDTNKNIVRVVDTESGELIRQIPAQEIIEIAKALDKLQGMIIRQKA
jgi:flagellar protein FlaG